MKLHALVIALLSLSLFASCGVPLSQHEALVAQLEQRNAEYDQLNKDVAVLTGQIADLQAREAALIAERELLQSRLDESNAALSMYESKTGGLENALRVTKTDIQNLREQRAAALKRLREYRELAQKLASMIESGQLSVSVRNSKMVIELPNAILFDPGKTELKPDGLAALNQLADVLKSVNGRSFLVAGHTDNVPIKVSGYVSNWELSTARASKVLHVLEAAGVAPDKLAAAGFGEFDPVATNETEQGKAKNRRTEIILMPKIEELPELPADLFAAKSS